MRGFAPLPWQQVAERWLHDWAANTSAIRMVSGISFAQISTQFCA